MKNKSKNARAKRVSQFRFYVLKYRSIKGQIKTKPHPAYVFLEKGNIYVFVSITHSKKIKGKIVVKLMKNPNPKDSTDSYYVEEIKEYTKDKFGKKLIGWDIELEDDLKIRNLYKK